MQAMKNNSNVQNKKINIHAQFKTQGKDFKYTVLMAQSTIR